MKNFSWVIIFIFLHIGSANSQDEHLEYIQNNYAPPGEYLNSLFKKNDLVIICEREHPELTQYDFFFEIVSQDWFVEKVGTVICEIASRSIQSKIDSVLFAENLAENELDALLVDINLNMSHHEFWPHKNFYNFLKSIYYLNQNIKQDKKIRLLGADIPIDWEELRTKEDRREYEKQYFPSRDRYMAEFIMDWYKKDTCKKAMIIMNTRHAFMNYSYKADENEKRKEGKSTRILNNVGAFIRHELPEKSTNVMLNNFTWNRTFKFRQRIAGGKWDKSFYLNNNHPCGLSLKNSPFGNDDFDYFPYASTNLKWNDVFDHLIFYNPLCDFISSSGVNGLIDKRIEDEILRRYNVNNNFKPFFTQQKIRKLNTENMSQYRFKRYCK
ncbi:MAG: hypothetical protein R6U65_09900 [Perlabentimonas sp.]